MTGRTHIAGGVALCGLAELSYLSITNSSTPIVYTMLFLASSTCGSLLSDIDETRSTIGRKLWFISWPVLLLKSCYKFILLLMFKKNRKSILDHRGITHYLITWFIMTCILFLPYTYCRIRILSLFDTSITLCIAAGISIGMLSHIMLDLISGKIALLYPFIKKKIGIMLIRSFSMKEVLFRLVLNVLNLSILLQLYHNI